MCSVGQLVWSRHAHFSLPTNRAIRSTCLRLLPLVEMYCRWELQEDCSDLQSLMHRYDSKTELETLELGRSLLLMIRSDHVGFDCVPPRVNIGAHANLFEEVRERLAAAAIAIEDLHMQVRPSPSLILGPHFLKFPCVLKQYTLVEVSTLSLHFQIIGFKHTVAVNFILQYKCLMLHTAYVLKGATNW